MKHINIFLGLITAFLLNSCFSDNGNYNYKDPLNIHIEGVKNAYTVSPTGDKLQISPKIYPEGRQYDCFWAIIPASASWGEQLDTISQTRIRLCRQLECGQLQIAFMCQRQGYRGIRL